MRILLINSHPQDLLCALEKAGHAVSAAENGVAADRKVRSVDYGVIVLDRGSVDDGDLSLVKEWRRRGISAYILVLATQLTLKDKVSVFDAGADGYVLPPNPHEQLMARVRALMRRDDHQAKETILRIFDLE